MLIDQLFEACRQEFSKAGRALGVVYELIQAADRRALKTLSMFFQDR
jgi:hypothetical protein